MIYLEPTSLGWRPLFHSWLEKIPQVLVEEHREWLEALFEWLVDPCLQFAKRNCKEYVTSMQANLVRSLMNLIEMLVDEAAKKEDAKENKHLRVWLTVTCNPDFYFCALLLE